MPAAPRLRRTQRKESPRETRLIRPVRECALILVKAGPFQQSPRNEGSGESLREASWRMFLSNPLESGEAGRSRRGTVLGGANCSREVSGNESPHYGVPFRAGALLWGRCHPRANDEGPSFVPLRDPSRFVMDLWARSFPGVWNSVGLSPVSVVNRCIWVRPRATLSDVRANRVMLGTDQAELGQCFSRLRSLARRQGRSGPSWIDLAWPLRRRPLLADAGCVGPGGLRARFSGRARTRPGRIKSSFRGTAPFETKFPHLRFTLSPTRRQGGTNGSLRFFRRSADGILPPKCP